MAKERKAFEEPIADLMNLRNQQIKKHDFEEKEATSEYMETHYFKETDVSSSKNLFAQSRFWADYAVYLSESPEKRN